MFRSQKEMKCQVFDNCHDGVGAVNCRHVIEGSDSELGFNFMHDDSVEPGASIGQHVHNGTEEIYYLLEGNGIMIMDGEEISMSKGDVSLVKSGHSHGLVNTGDLPMRLLVIECGKKPCD